MSDLPQEMAQLLADLQQEGRLDSSGEFTLDFAHGVDKLRQFQLAQPSDYVLKLVQSAVAGGATKIAVAAHDYYVHLAYDGQSLSATELANLAAHLLRGSADQPPHLRHLAVGLNSALGCEVEELVVESWGDGVGSALVLNENAQQTGQIAASMRAPGTRVYLRKRARSLGPGNMWRGYFADEHRAVQERCGFCTVPITWNRSRTAGPDFGRAALPQFLGPLRPVLSAVNFFTSMVTDSVIAAHGHTVQAMGKDADPAMPWWVQIWNVEDYVFGACHKHHHLIERRYRAQASERALRLAERPLCSLLEYEPPEAVSGPVSRALALEMDLQPMAWLRFVQDGVVVCEKRPDLRCQGAVGVVSAHGISTDLSHFNLVEDEAYDRCLQDLRQAFADLTQRLRAFLASDPRHVPLGQHVRSRLRQ